MDSFPDVFVVCILFLTITVTVATAEGSFFKLKLLKNYLRNCTGQGRLSSIAILNFESKRTKELDI